MIVLLFLNYKWTKPYHNIIVIYIIVYFRYILYMTHNVVQLYNNLSQNTQI